MTLHLLAARRAVPAAFFRHHPLFLISRSASSDTSYNNDILQAQKQQFKVDPPPSKSTVRLRRYHYYLLSIATGALIGTIYALRQVRKHEGVLPEYVTNAEVLERKAMEARPLPPPVSRRVTFDSPPREHFPFKLTLYQYVTCPFCCKVRAYLNYNRIPYDIVEVNSVIPSETRWSLYNRVPIAVLENEQVQLNDSSMIISAVESYLRQPTVTFQHVMKYFKCIVEKDQKGNLFFTYPDKYVIAEPAVADRLTRNEDEHKLVAPKASRSFFDRFFSRAKPVPVEEAAKPVTPRRSQAENDFERQWREWVDNKFLHVISPNIYCTLRQSLRTFRWFSQAGDWEEIFPWYQRWIAVYLGSIFMRAFAVRLKKKYHLHDDVRVSLYECANEWVDAIGDRDFLGGSKPNLADLNVYGILTTIQGCDAFDDLMTNTKIQPWFERMKHLVEPHRIDTAVRLLA